MVGTSTLWVLGRTTRLASLQPSLCSSPLSGEYTGLLKPFIPFMPKFANEQYLDVATSTIL